jgi:hypothetical protein
MRWNSHGPMLHKSETTIYKQNHEMSDKEASTKAWVDTMGRIGSYKATVYSKCLDWGFILALTLVTTVVLVPVQVLLPLVISSGTTFYVFPRRTGFVLLVRLGHTVGFERFRPVSAFIL